MNSPDRFTCEETFRRLDDYLDRALTEQETQKIEEHLENCIHCARAFRFEEGVISGVRAKLKRIELPPDLGDKIAAKLAEADAAAADA